MLKMYLSWFLVYATSVPFLCSCVLGEQRSSSAENDVQSDKTELPRGYIRLYLPHSYTGSLVTAQDGNH